MRIEKIFLTALFIASFFSAFAQELSNKQKVELELAIQHYQKKEFEQAIHYLEDIYDKSSERTVYDYLFRSYLQLEDFKKAEKVIKKQKKSFPNETDYVVDLGYVYISSGDREKGDEEFNEAIEMATNTQRSIVNLANQFIGINELHFAEQTYLKGKKKVKTYPFNFELAGIYYQLQEYEKMIDEYLNLLEFNEGYLQSVQNALQSPLSSTSEADIRDLLRRSLLKKIQKNPGDDIFSEMLIWLYVQEKDFYGAFIQAKALDKRNNESGNRMVALAKLSESNQDYETAVKCYQYVIDKGPDGMRYQAARKGLVNTYNEKLVNSLYSEDDLRQLELLYKETLKDLGKNRSTVDLATGLAHLQAFYLDKVDTSISLLNKTIKIPGISEEDKAIAKLELGDIYIIKNKIWEASLLYSQVESSFKYDQLGQEAKFKNAKVFYYSGDFNWSKAQLDVLKGSTSKLIANDAMELSLLISDNTTLDTARLPLIKFAKAELLILQNKSDQAMKLLDSIAYLFPGHSLQDEIIYKKYEIYFKEKNYKQAAEELTKLFEGNKDDILTDNAIFLAAGLFENYLGNTDKAMELYRKLLKDYGDSIYATEARRRFRMLRGDSIN